MICGKIGDEGIYAGCAARLRAAFDFMRTCGPSTPNGRHELDGDNLYAVVSDSPLRPWGEGLPEAHRRYVDVQFPLVGEETIGVAPLRADAADLPFDDARDIAFYEQKTSPLTLAPGEFAVFFPHDAHLPCRTCTGAKSVKKVVVKVRI